MGTKAAKSLLRASTAERDAQEFSSDEDSDHEEPRNERPKSMHDLPPDDSDDESHTNQKLSTRTTSRRTALKEKDAITDNPIIPREEDPKAIRKMDKTEAKAVFASNIEGLGATNRGFTACIQQYGIKVPEEDDSKADAGKGERWQRMYGLFGTMIS